MSKKTRVDAYLQACKEGLGCEGLPTPITRIDHLLYDLAEELAKPKKYTDMTEKPKINSVELVGNKSGSDLSVEDVANRATVINASSDNNHYPTAKAVKDFAETFEKPWERFRYFNPYAVDPTTDTSGITWITDENNHVYGFEIDTDELGKSFAYTTLFIKVVQGYDATTSKPSDIYINGVKIGTWSSAQVKFLNRVGRLLIFRLGEGYEMAYHGMDAYSGANAWINQAALDNGASFANGELGKVAGKISKIKIISNPENYYIGNYYVGMWGQK